MQVTKRSGEKQGFDLSKIKVIIDAACDELEDVNSVEILEEVGRIVYDGIKTREIDFACIMSAKQKVPDEPNYSYVAARLLLYTIYKEVLGKKYEQFSEYTNTFKTNIVDMITTGLLKPELQTKFDLDELANYLKPERDLLFKYFGLQTIYDRYLKTYEGRRLETPQTFWMRVAMGLAYNEQDPNAAAKEMYDVMSQFLYCPSSPTLFNSGCVKGNYSSCFLSVFSDSIPGIFGGIMNESLKSKNAGGLGISLSNLRGNGSRIRISGKSGGVIPWAKVVDSTAVAVNQMDLRKGAAAVWLEVSHPDIEDFHDLKKNTGDERRRTHDLHTGDWVPDIFMQAVKDNDEWLLVCPSEAPELHESYGINYEEHYKKYLHLHKEGKLKTSRLVRAKDIFKELITQAFETGHPFVGFKDRMNESYTNKHCGIVHNTNLCCVTGDQRVPTQYGLLRVDELLDKGNLKVVGRDKIEDSTPIFKTLINQPILNVVTENGYEHKVTYDHPLWVLNKGWTKAEDLKIGDKIETQQIEGLWGSENHEKLALIYGMLVGDGCIDNESAYIDLWPKSLCMVDILEKYIEDVIQEHLHLIGTHFAIQVAPKFGDLTSVNKRRLSSVALKRIFNHYGVNKETKKEIPDFIWKGTKQTVCNYLLGLYVSDGTIQSIPKNQSVISLCSIDKNLLRNVQILLANMGIKTHINLMRNEGYNSLPDGKNGVKDYLCKTVYRLLITSIKGCRIFENNVNFAQYRKTTLLENLKNQGYKQKLYTKVKELQSLPNEDVYCLMVNSDEHAWVCNGLVTKNTEIGIHNIASTYDDYGDRLTIGEDGVCTIGSINLIRHAFKTHQVPHLNILRVGNSILDNEYCINLVMLKKTIAVSMRMLDNAVTNNHYPTRESANGALRHRPVGLGHMGFQDLMQLVGIKYDSEKAGEYSNVIEEFISYYAILESHLMSKYRNSYASFEGSEWSKGKMPYDWRKDKLEFNLDWEWLREQVKLGMRNSLVRAIAPTACVKEDTLILSSEGLLPIKVLGKGITEKWKNINISVSQENSLEKSDKVYYNGVVETLKITTERGHEIECTKEHRLRVIDINGDYVWKYVKDINIGDFIVRRIGGHEEICGNKPYVELNSNVTSTINRKHVILPEVLNEKLAEILGFYMANGSKKRDVVRLHICGSYDDLLNHFGNSCEELFELGHTVTDLRPKGTNLVTFNLFSSKVVKWFDLNDFTKINAKQTFVPLNILKSNSSVLAAFFRGWFEADGSVSLLKNGTPVITGASISFNFIKTAMTCLEALGIKTKIRKIRPGTLGTNPVYELRVLNIRNCRIFQEKINFISNYKKELLDSALKSIKSIECKGESIRIKQLIKDFRKHVDKWNNYLNTCVSQSRLAYETIRNYEDVNTKNSIVYKYIHDLNMDIVEVVKIESTGLNETYDISVPENNTYIANGFVSHNTISHVTGTSSGVDQMYSVVFSEKTLSGSFTQLNEYFVRDLKKMGLWNKSIINKVKEKDGDLKEIEEIPYNIRMLYRNCFQQDNKQLIRNNSKRQRWVDQAISFNIYYGGRSKKELAELYMYAWEEQLKTIYYCRTPAASKINKNLSKQNPPEVCDVNNKDCDACQ